MSDFEIFEGDTKKVTKMFRHDNIILVFSVLLAAVIGILVASGIMFYSNQQKSNVIQSGIFIKGINVSGLTKDEAVKLVENELKSQMNDHIELTYENYNYYVEVEQIEAKFDIEAYVNFAFNIAKTGNLFQDMQENISVLMKNI